MNNNKKKEASGGGGKNPKPKIFGATQLQIDEHDASRLVGGVVEKGFSDNGPKRPPAPPRPTVMPFPVARHRSHGPHWAPKIGNSNVTKNDNEDEDAREEEDCDGMELASGASRPIERKEKKGLDFSQWKEIAKNDGKSVLPEKKREVGSSVGSEVGRKAKELHSLKHAKSEDNVQQRKGTAKFEESATVENVPKWQNRSSEEAQVNLKPKGMPKYGVASGLATQKLVGGEEHSLESQIDVENRSRLAKMSTDEISEAQAELMAKLDPALIDVLKKRSQSKVKRQKFSLTDEDGGEADTMEQEKNLSKLTVSSDNTISKKPAELIPIDQPRDKDDKGSTDASPENRSMWVAWRQRVECVRDVRFSVDGNIIRSELSHVSDTGKASSESTYNAENVSERDFIRTEGDPGAAGYTIKEAVSLARSVVPGQRTFALHLIAVILNKAIGGICQNQVDASDAEGTADWEAIWAFALGPEPELALALRMCLDDNFISVVLACAEAIQCALSCDMNEIIFDILEKTPTYNRDLWTAPVFRSKPDISVGFLRGGFWKYNTKPSNISCFGEEEPDCEKPEGERTIQDDVFVAGQDFAAGLVRMGILQRICYFLETDPIAPLEECFLSILIAIARHSPTCAAAILSCERLLQTIVNRFATKEQMEINSIKIKSVKLLKVLARVDKKNCLKFINEEILQKVTWHLYRYTFSLDQWMKSGKESCKLSSSLMVEQLRLLKVFIHYGYYISEIPNLFASLCIWLSAPAFDKLSANDTMSEYCAITNEAYLLLEVLAVRLPNFYSNGHKETDDSSAQDDEEFCSWNFFGSIIDLALEWVQLNSIPQISHFQDSEVNSLLWVISSVLGMLSSVLKNVAPEDITSLPNGLLPWLPEFVPKTGLGIIKNRFLRSSGLSDNSSLVEYLCLLRNKNAPELAISSTCCLQGLVKVVDSVDKLIQLANLDIHHAPSKFDRLSGEDKVLSIGILKSCADEVQFLLTTLMKLIINEGQSVRPVEVFSRGGPAPGVGVGWGASNGGYWSLKNFLGQEDARLLVHLLEISEAPLSKDPLEATQMLNCALTACLAVGPGNNSHVIDKLLKFIFRVPVLKYLDLGIQNFLSLKNGHRWKYEEDEYESFASVLTAHFRNRWLSVKKKKKGKSTGEKKSIKKDNRALETIFEDNADASKAVGHEELLSLRAEWAHQRLPLPAHWFLSAISTVYSEKPSDFLEVARGGLFFLLGTESLSDSPTKGVPVVWKLHAMSVILLSGMEILSDEKSRDVYETLQNIYGEIVDDGIKLGLQFEKEVHENYATFVETLIEQFAAESYGDVLFGRQVAMYLRRSVEGSVRLAAWNALSNARALELLPHVDGCFTKAEGFLDPVEVLARVDKKNCLKFINEEILQKVTWHLYRYTFSLDQWMKSGKESCKLSSSLMVEQLRLLKVFIHYGYYISEIPNLFASLCIWLSAPAFDKLSANDTMSEYCAITNEAYLLLEVLAVRLPNFYSNGHKETDDSSAQDDEEFCSWNFFGSIIDLALEWVQLNSIPQISHFQDSEVNSLLWVISSVLGMLSSVLKNVAPEDITSLPNGLLPWLPEFVPKTGLGIIKNRFLRSSGLSDNSSLVEYLCLLRNKNAPELAISSTCCLQGLVKVVDSVDKLIQLANLDIHHAPSKFDRLSGEDKVLSIGILKSCADEVQFLLTTLMKLIINEGQSVRPVEVFSRGGPAPGVGVGWGASNGGYWSLKNFLGQEDARLLVHLLEISEAPLSKDPLEATQMLNCALTACLAVGPGNNSHVIDKLLKFIFRVPVLKYLDLGIQNFLSLKNGHRWKYEEDEYESFASVLTAHFRNRWLSVKKKKKGKSTGEKKSIKKDNRALETIFEDNADASKAVGHEELLSLRAEWAHQRLPLPAHWFLSAISTVYSEKPSDFLEVARGGLFFLLGTESLSDSPTKGVPVVWKLHAMSVILLSGMEILSDEKSRDVYETLQNIYGEIVDDGIKLGLQFEKEVHENYATFVETLIEQFAAESYGDVLFGRQVAMYLRRSVEGSVRLAAWNALSNARALELLPHVDGCFTKAEGFLDPVEDNERILEAYVKSWVSGALDKAENRSSVTFSLVLHHLSSFIFVDISGDMLTLRNKLVKSLMRDYSRKHQHEGMMVKLICYTRPSTTLQPVQEMDASTHLAEIEKRLRLLKEICEGHVAELEKLESCIRKTLNTRT